MQDTYNSHIEKLPAHLKQYIKPQVYEDYTAIDQAVWRYVMRINVSHLSKVAHESYVSGLKKAGLEIDNIAHMYGMNRILKEIGWAAVAVDGFIPPSAFMEFQAYKVLVIAADIRQLNHIEYTPAPDIIHEAAGHAPIIADPEYAEYLRLFGEIGAKAISSAKDFELYEAIRHLSIIKEYPFTPKENIEEAERRIAEIQQNMGEPSEMALIRRLHWWTVEYGLIGTLDNPKIYGAGLLSSIGESVTCLKLDVKKIPYTIDAVNYEFDITKPQPQLFVTPDFAHLTTVLNQFADTMALRRGGAYGVRLAMGSENVCTLVLDSGIQISGVMADLKTNADDHPIMVATKGPTALAFENKQLAGMNKHRFQEGFFLVLSPLKDINMFLSELSESQLLEMKVSEGENCELAFRDNFIIQGRIAEIKKTAEGKLLYIRFTDAELWVEGKTKTFEEFLLPIGKQVISVFSGAADKEAYSELIRIPAEGTYKVVYDTRTKRLQELYQEVRNIRNAKGPYDRLWSIFNKLNKDYPEDWLLSLEIYELLHESGFDNSLMKNISIRLNQLCESHKQFRKLIQDGLSLIESKSEIGV
ncbi:MAG: aromatic amino acid hydroxylase [Flavobacteriales bacterium]